MSNTHADPTRTYRTLLRLILAGFVILATIYSLVTPIFEASDELWHYPMVKYIADHHFGLPVQRAGLSDAEAPWRQEGGQPPLYYMLGAALTFWIDTDDMPEVRRLNQHADIGVIVPDGNVNMVLHSTEREAFPWSGTVLAVRLVRFLSILMGFGTVYITYLLGRELFPASPAIALGAAAFVAFNPMFLFISAVINNDNLSTLMASVLLLLIVRLLKRRDPPTLRTYLWLGLAAGAGMLAKFQIGFMLVLVALALLIVTIRRRDWRIVVVGGGVSGGLTILIAGWWYWRNVDLYGDATGINIFLDIVGRRAAPADLSQLWTERETFMMSFWGFFGGVNVPMWDAVYTLFNVLAGFAILGLLYSFYRSARLWRRILSPEWSHPPNPSPHTENERAAVGLTRFFALIWPIIVFLSLITWTRQTPASQGRLMFSAIAPLMIGLAAGLAAWSPNSAISRAINFGMAGLVFLSIAITMPFTIIRPAYRLDHDAAWTGDTLESGTSITACFREPESPDQDGLCIEAQSLDGAIQPGDYLLFDPVITVDHAMSHNWSIFVHLINEDGIIEAQRDVYPGGGLVATAEIDPGESWVNTIAVKLPLGLYTPQTLTVSLGFYDYATHERMIAVGDHADSAANRVQLGQIRLEAAEGSVPNPVDVNFDHKMTLLGYTITDRSLKPGESTEVTLYWSARRASLDGYAISYQIIEPDTLVKAAQDDNFPSPPTETWSPGTTVTETRALTIDPNAAPGRYRLMVRVYPYENGIAGSPLRIRASDGGQSEDFVWLSWIEVETPNGQGEIAQ